MFGFRKPTVKCETCSCLLLKGDAQRIEVVNSSLAYYIPSELFYCKVHEKPYDSITIAVDLHKFYFSKIAVSEDGTPIGYVKEKTTKTPPSDSGLRVCNKCHKEKNLLEFHRRKTDELGRQKTCKVCMLAYHKLRNSK